MVIFMESGFFALMSRMKYIDRWALMRNSNKENICEHSLEVGMLAHVLAVIGNVRFEKQFNGEKAALMGLYHDSTEIITGDMPTPIKYYNSDIKNAFQEIEQVAARQLLRTLPEDLQSSFTELFLPKEEDANLWKLVKAADKLSALIKCIEEEKAGNSEFVRAKASIEESLLKMELDEVKVFLEEFLPAYYKNIDELNG